MWGSLRMVEGALPSPARDVLQGSLDILTTPRITRRYEVEEEHSSLGFEPPCDAAVTLLRTDVFSHPGSPPAPALEPGGACRFQRACELLVLTKPSSHASWLRRRSIVSFKSLGKFSVKFPVRFENPVAYGAISSHSLTFMLFAGFVGVSGLLTHSFS